MREKKITTSAALSDFEEYLVINLQIFIKTPHLNRPLSWIDPTVLFCEIDPAILTGPLQLSLLSTLPTIEILSGHGFIFKKMKKIKYLN